MPDPATAPATKTLWAVMRAHEWSALEANGIPLTSPVDGPQRFIPVFDSQEQAAEWASDGDTILPLRYTESTTARPEANTNA
jgi:hypothetical protein